MTRVLRHLGTCVRLQVSWPAILLVGVCGTYLVALVRLASLDSFGVFEAAFSAGFLSMLWYGCLTLCRTGAMQPTAKEAALPGLPMSRLERSVAEVSAGMLVMVPGLAASEVLVAVNDWSTDASVLHWLVFILGIGVLSAALPMVSPDRAWLAIGVTAILTVLVTMAAGSLPTPWILSLAGLVTAGAAALPWQRWHARIEARAPERVPVLARAPMRPMARLRSDFLEHAVGAPMLSRFLAWGALFVLVRTTWDLSAFSAFYGFLPLSLTLHGALGFPNAIAGGGGSARPGAFAAACERLPVPRHAIARRSAAHATLVGFALVTLACGAWGWFLAQARPEAAHEALVAACTFAWLAPVLAAGSVASRFGNAAVGGVSLGFATIPVFLTATDLAAGRPLASPGTLFLMGLGVVAFIVLLALSVPHLREPRARRAEP